MKHEKKPVKSEAELIRKSGRCLKIMARLEKDSTFRGRVALFLAYIMSDNEEEFTKYTGL